jgi:hypothetical protein
MKWISIASLIAIVVGGGAALSSPPEKRPPQVPVPAPNAAKLAGIYYHGDGVGVNIYLSLKPDGSYLADLYGCGGFYAEARGNWGIAANTITLSPFQKEDPLRGYLRTLDIVNVANRFVFVRPEGRERFEEHRADALNPSVGRYWCFQPRDKMPKNKDDDWWWPL